MFIANDSNYTFGQFLAAEYGDDIKAPVYSKCFTNTEVANGFRFNHDPEETDPEKCVCFSIYDETSSAATATAFGKGAAVSDLTSILFRLDTAITGGVLREVPYYHVIVPVQNIADDTIKYLVIKMTKEVELFPENYPYYELVDTFADAKPTSAEAPGGGSSDFTTATVTFINSGDVGSYYTISGLAFVNTENNMIEVKNGIDDTIFVYTEYSMVIPLYKGKYQASLVGFTDVGEDAPVSTGAVTFDSESLILTITGDGTFSCRGVGGDN